jgi:hypothetical protein
MSTHVTETFEEATQEMAEQQGSRACAFCAGAATHRASISGVRTRESHVAAIEIA